MVYSAHYKRKFVQLFENKIAQIDFINNRELLCHRCMKTLFKIVRKHYYTNFELCMPYNLNFFLIITDYVC